MTLDNPTTLVP